jgi:hypothetical protein
MVDYIVLIDCIAAFYDFLPLLRHYHSFLPTDSNTNYDLDRHSLRI